VLSVAGNRRVKSGREIGSGASVAVLHAGKHVETEERFGFSGAEFIADGTEIIDGVERGDGRIVPAVIDD